MTPYIEIYQAAHHLDHEKLLRLKARYKTVNIYNGIESVIEKLAREKQHEAVKLLTAPTMGGSIACAIRGYASVGLKSFVNELSSCSDHLRHAVYGAASSGNIDFTNELIARGAMIDSAIVGAAWGGQIDLTNDLIALSRPGSSESAAVIGAAKAGLREFTNDLIKRGARIENAAVGAAQGNHIELLNTLIELGVSIDSAVHGAASAGHFELSDELLKLGGTYATAIYAAATGGHTDYCEKLIQRGAPIDSAAYGAAWGQSFDYANELIARGASLDYVVIGAAECESTKYVEEYIQRGASHYSAIYGSALSGYTKQTDELLALTNDEESLREAVRGSSSGLRIELTKKLLDRGAPHIYAIYGAASYGNSDYVNQLIQSMQRTNSYKWGVDIDNVYSLVSQILIRDDKNQIKFLPEYIRHTKILKLIECNDAMNQAFEYLKESINPKRTPSPTLFKNDSIKSRYKRYFSSALSYDPYHFYCYIFHFYSNKKKHILFPTPKHQAKFEHYLLYAKLNDNMKHYAGLTMKNVILDKLGSECGLVFLMPYIARCQSIIDDADISSLYTKALAMLMTGNDRVLNIQEKDLDEWAKDFFKKELTDAFYIQRCVIHETVKALVIDENMSLDVIQNNLMRDNEKMKVIPSDILENLILDIAKKLLLWCDKYPDCIKYKSMLEDMLDSERKSCSTKDVFECLCDVIDECNTTARVLN